eukprot:g4299.t1
MPGGAAEAAGRGTASSRGATVALERLRQVLSKMSREKRQEALQQLPAEVQAALVSFMETSKAELPARAPKPRAARAPALVDEVSGATGCAAGRAGTRSIGRGILRQATSPPSYKASVFLRSMFVASRPSPSLEHILQLHSALLRARELLETCDVNSHRFREAFEEACREAELDAAKALQMLTFTAIIPAYYEVNRQIKGRQTADLDAAFALRERLLEARATGWPALREEWIAIMQSPPEAGTGHKAATAEEAARIADAAWEAGIPQRAKMEARRAARPPKRKSGEDSAEVTLEEAAAAVSKVLKAFVALVLELAAKPTATFGYRLLPLQACSYGRSAAGAASPGTGPGLVAYAFVDAQLEGAPPLLPPSRRYWGLLRAGARQHGLDRSYRDYLYSLPRYVPSPLSAAALPTVLSASAAKGLEGLVEASRAGRLVDLAARDPRGEAWPTLDGLAFLGTGTLVIGPDCADPSSGESLVEVLHNIQRNLVELHARAGGRGVSNHLHCMS